MAADLIPAERLSDWTPGVTVGVPGGIPTNRTKLIDVTKAPYNADNTGKEDARKAIEAAIAAAAKDDVVYLPAGTYRGGIYVGARGYLTIRGDGPGKTILTGPISVGAGGADWWYPNRLKFSVTGSPKRGATELTVGDTKPLDGLPNGGIGAVCQVAPKNDLTLPVGTPGNFEYLRRQETRIVKKTPTTVTISPGLLFDLPESLSPILRPTVLRAESVGIEDLTVDGKDINAQIGVGISAGYACWVKNVHILNINNYHISIPDSLQCEIRHCYIAKRKGAGSNGAGILVGTTAFCLFEDNVLREQFPHFEVNSSVGNVIAYNFCDDSAIQGMNGCSIDSNHGPHCSFNLYEGNVASRFQCDGYHGSSSHDTAFRNWFHGTDEKAKEFWICVNLNRFTRDYSIVGNILGRKGHEWLYEVEPTGFSYEKHYIYSLGYPNMGNGWANGKTAQLSKGKPWEDWVKAKEGKPHPGAGGYQELDLDVPATTILKGNYSYCDKDVRESESLKGATLPASLYRKEKPAWFGDLKWPPFGPDTDFEKNKIPAQLRFETMNKK